MFRKKFFTYLLFFGGAVLLAVMASGCFFSAPAGKLVTPEIRAFGLPDASVVGSVSLKVTGPDMVPVEVSYSQLPSVINISIPEGNEREFELTVATGTGYTGPVTSYKGTATADVTSDSAVVTLHMGIGSTKIIVPDAGNNRLVQIDDMSGAGWGELKGSDMLAFAYNDSNFVPGDVDYDEYGNIYVANAVSSALYGGIWRFTSIRDTTPVRVLSSLNGMKAVAVDRKNGRVYGVDGTNTVLYVDYDGISGSGSFTSTIVDIINGITVDDLGDLYLSGSSSNIAFLIGKYPYINLTANDSFEDWSGIVSGGDCVVFKGGLYVTASDGNLYQFNPQNLTNSGSLTSISDVPAVSVSFNSPSIFLATMNDRLTVADDGSSSIVSVDGMDGSGYKTFGGNGTGINQFTFFGGNFYGGGAQ